MPLALAFLLALAPAFASGSPREAPRQDWIPYVHDWGCRLHMFGPVAGDTNDAQLRALTSTMGITFIRQAAAGALSDWDLEPTFGLGDTALLIRFHRSELKNGPIPVRVRLAGVALKQGLGHRPGQLDVLHFGASGEDVRTIRSALSTDTPAIVEITTAESTYKLTIDAKHFAVASAMMEACIHGMSHN